jgi:ATP-dependent Clp protease ATP-binding subunit ClpC
VHQHGRACQLCKVGRKCALARASFRARTCSSRQRRRGYQSARRIKGAYEQFHSVTYTEDALTHAVRYAGTFIKSGSLPGKTVTVIDEAGASVQVQKGKLQEEVAEIRKRIHFIAQRMEGSIANHEFEKARSYSGEERKERENLVPLIKNYHLDHNAAFAVGREEIESAVSKISGVPVEMIRQSRSVGPPPGPREDPAQS